MLRVAQGHRAPGGLRPVPRVAGGCKIRAGGHWQYAAMTAPSRWWIYVTPDGCPIRKPGMLAVAPFMTPLGGDEGGAGPGGRRFCRGQECGSVWWWRGYSVQRSEQQPRASFPGRFAGPVVGKPGAGVPGSWPPPGPGRVPPCYQLATGIHGRVDRRYPSRLAESLEDAWLSCHYRGWCPKGGTCGTSDDHVRFRSPLVHAVLDKVGVLLGDPQAIDR